MRDSKNSEMKKMLAGDDCLADGSSICWRVSEMVFQNVKV